MILLDEHGYDESPDSYITGINKELSDDDESDGYVYDERGAASFEFEDSSPSQEKRARSLKKSQRPSMDQS